MQIAQTVGLKDHDWAAFPDLPFYDTSSPAVQAMDTAIDKYYPGLRRPPSFRGPTPSRTTHSAGSPRR